MFLVRPGANSTSIAAICSKYWFYGDVENFRSTSHCLGHSFLCHCRKVLKPDDLSDNQEIKASTVPSTMRLRYVKQWLATEERWMALLIAMTPSWVINPSSATFLRSRLSRLEIAIAFTELSIVRSVRRKE